LLRSPWQEAEETVNSKRNLVTKKKGAKTAEVGGGPKTTCARHLLEGNLSAIRSILLHIMHWHSRSIGFKAENELFRLEYVGSRNGEPSTVVKESLS
jgi:hypothetical protein